MLPAYYRQFFAYFDYVNHRHPTVWYSHIPNNEWDAPIRKKSLWLSCVMSTKSRARIPGYRQRLEFVGEFVRRYRTSIHVYGRGQPNQGVNGAYRGPLNYAGLCTRRGYKPYEYSFVCENSTERGQISDRFNDAILNLTMPIYWGGKNVGDFYPEDSYYTIDILKDPVEKLYDISRRPVTLRNLDSMREARRLILYKYNIWEVISQAIKERT